MNRNLTLWKDKFAIYYIKILQHTSLVKWMIDWLMVVQRQDSTILWTFRTRTNKQYIQQVDHVIEAVREKIREIHTSMRKWKFIRTGGKLSLATNHPPVDASKSCCNGSCRAKSMTPSLREASNKTYTIWPNVAANLNIPKHKRKTHFGDGDHVNILQLRFRFLLHGSKLKMCKILRNSLFQNLSILLIFVPIPLHYKLLSLLKNDKNC